MSAATTTATHLLTQTDGCRPDASPAHTPTPNQGSGAPPMLPNQSDEIPATKALGVLGMLIEYVRTGHAETAMGRLEFAASEAARTCTLAKSGRTTAITLLCLAAESAGVGRADAELVLAAAFRGVPR